MLECSVNPHASIEGTCKLHTGAQDSDPEPRNSEADMLTTTILCCQPMSIMSSILCLNGLSC